MKKLHWLTTMVLGCILMMLVVSGCGRKGPLYIPPPPDQSAGRSILHLYYPTQSVRQFISRSSHPDRFVAQLPTL